jgi:hypothetical protein
MTDLEHADMRELRSDLLEYMRERFDKVDGRLDRIDGLVSTHEARISVVETTVRHCRDEQTKPAPAPTPLYKDPKTYTIGTVGTALGVAVLKVLEVITSSLSAAGK